MENIIEFDEEKHEYTVDGKKYPGVTDILSPITGTHYGNINPAVIAQAAARGSIVHETLEQYDYGNLEASFPAEIFPYVKAYVQFIRDYSPEWIDIERPVYSPGFGYCGTLDRYGIIDGVECVVDIKTNSAPTKENYISVCAQTAAYDEARNHWRGDASRKFEKGKEVKRYALYLKKEGDYRLFDCRKYESDNEFNGFQLFSECNELRRHIDRIKNWKNGEKTNG